MTHPAHWAATLALLTALSAPGSAAEPSAAPGGFPSLPARALDSIPDLPLGPAAIRGRVVHEIESAEVGNIPVILYALSPNGEPGLRGMLTDASGAFAFESIANDPAIVYLLGARYAEIPFGVRLAFEAGELERELELPIADANSDTSRVTVGEVEIEIERGCASLTVRESYRLENPGARTLYVPEAERSGRGPILRVTLPEHASELRSELTDNLEKDGDALSFWGPLRPGGQQLEFRYEIPESGAAFEFRREFASGARSLALVERQAGPRLARSGSGNPEIRPGDSITLRVELPDAAEPADRISLLESRIWLELDDAALSVDQQHQLAVEGSEPLRSAAGEPLLCIALPEAASDLRFSSETLAMGLSRDASGALAVRGPLPAGETEISLHFLLPIDRDGPLVSHVMPLDVPLLSVLIADTGLAIESNRLHRRRPIRTPDRSYLQLEGFEIPAGDSVEFRLRPLDARRALPGPAAAGVAFAAAALAIGLLIAPLRDGRAGTSAAPLAASHAAEQRESVLAAIHGLDEDFEVGKLTEADYREMRLALRAEAVDLLRVERAALSQSAQPTAAGACPRCRAAAAADARFCSQCGAPLGGAPAAGGASAAEAASV